MYPSIMKFGVDGVSLAEQTFNCNKVTCSVNLERLGPRTSGAYRCEISGDAPEFKLVSKTANMTIAGINLNSYISMIIEFEFCLFLFSVFPFFIPISLICIIVTICVWSLGYTFMLGSILVVKYFSLAH